MSRTLEDWLAHAERLHHRPVDLGLERLRQVAARLPGLLPDPTVTTCFVVGGTNGKGSTCALIESMLRAGGYRVARYGSPHLVHFSERARLDGAPLPDAVLAESCAAVEAARADTPLTYFEFTTLAIVHAFTRAQPDAMVLEVGLGGRLDAVNLVDADVAVVTSVGLDHTEMLGPTREAIGWEKAHIFRPGRPALCADPDPPASLLEHARSIGADLRLAGRDFAAERPPGEKAGAPARQWNFRGRHVRRAALPAPALRGPHQLDNAAAALAALEAVQALSEPRLALDQAAVRQGLASVSLEGRFQCLPGRPLTILDVGHNPHAAHALALALREQAATGASGPVHAVFGMLRDKDAAGVVDELHGEVAHWHLAGTEGERGQSAQALAQAAFGGQRPALYPDVATALAGARAAAGPDDRILVFGSFLVVAAALRALQDPMSMTRAR